MAEEMEKTFPVSGDEPIVSEGTIRRRTWYGTPESWLRLTTRRLLILAHRPIGADRIMVIPGGALQGISEPSGMWITLGFRGPAGEVRTLQIQSFIPGLHDDLVRWFQSNPPA